MNLALFHDMVLGAVPQPIHKWYIDTSAAQGLCKQKRRKLLWKNSGKYKATRRGGGNASYCKQNKVWLYLAVHKLWAQEWWWPNAFPQLQTILRPWTREAPVIHLCFKDYYWELRNTYLKLLLCSPKWHVHVSFPLWGSSFPHWPSLLLQICNWELKSWVEILGEWEWSQC